MGLAMILLSLPIPPSANRYWRYAGRKPYRSPEANAYKEAVGWKCIEAKAEPLTASALCIEMKFVGLRANRDLDNCIKVLLDALQGYTYKNDNKIARIVAERCPRRGKQTPCVEIRLFAMGERAS